MQKFILILITGLLLNGCAPQISHFAGNNENNVTIDLNILDRQKGPKHPPTLARANQWCNQFNKTAKYLKHNNWGGYQYLCIVK
tara:strand:+ start:595 stop:846 length:252 start_codon:yes stop_codon:yes gene_type:complete